MKGGSLEQAMQQRFDSGQDFNEEAVAAIIKQLVQAVHFMQQNNIVHRDIKPGRPI